MKKIYLLAILFSTQFIAYAQTGCVIDSTNTNFFAPRPDSLPCVERTVYYDQTIQIAVPTSINLQNLGAPIPFVLYVDSVVITGVNGLPNGISYTPNPANGVLYGGQKGCAQVFGTTTDPAARYPITFEGTFTAHGFPFPPYFDGDTTIDFATLQGLSQGMFDLFLDVINPGDECRPASGIANFSASLNALVRVYPNPSNGVFHFSVNSGKRLTGTIEVMNIAGQAVTTQAIDAIGLFETTFNLSNMPRGMYTVLLKTSEGVAAKNISVE
ncbi:MAG: T9SS type A sorting domain-containing protein [Chitinophagales bacterium]|nr:T9SS type A sorting domain-containing protein [Chitinophagales bacterium]